mmetsp:Transcript_22935/g.74727  ORF Transcript_22935/g.74727 Transcript_22935/m.74727 type:complete len:160 (-) Transcript_22935:73-552(-)
MLGMAFRPLAIICRPLAVFIGFVYPSYASYKALESKTPEAAAQWLTYWLVFSLFTVFEFCTGPLLNLLPLYYVLKLSFILWLQLPQTKGASRLFVTWIQPNIKKHEEAIDQALEEGLRTGETKLKEWTGAVYRNMATRTAGNSHDAGGAGASELPPSTA